MPFQRFDPKELKILHELWYAPGASRSDIAALTGLDPSTVSRTMGSLIDLGLVEAFEEGEAGPQGGRKPVKLRIRTEYGLVAGIELQSSVCHALAVDLHGHIRFRRSAAYRDGDASVTALFSEALEGVRNFASNAGLPLLSASVGLPGLINPDLGLILRSNPMEIYEVYDFAAKAEESCGLPVLVENDVRCCCWAELIGRNLRLQDDFVYVLGEFRRNKLRNPVFEGIALGLGLVLHGQVYTGARYSAGEFRSVFYEESRANNQLALPDELLIRLDSSAEVQERFGAELGKNLALLVNMLNLPRVIFGGSLYALGDGLLVRVKREIEKNWLYPDQGQVAVQFSNFGDDSVAYGAACRSLAAFLGL